MSIMRDTERFLLNTHERPWGFVIYRTDYSSDADFARALKVLIEVMHESVNCELESARLLERSLDSGPCDRIISNHHPEVIEDREKFSGLALEDIRQHFIAMMVQRVTEYEQLPPEERRTQPWIYMKRAACIVLDSDGIESILATANLAKRPSSFPYGKVKVLDAAYDAEEGPQIQRWRVVDAPTESSRPVTTFDVSDDVSDANIYKSIKQMEPDTERYPYYGWVNVPCHTLWELYAQLPMYDTGFERFTEVDEHGELQYIP